MWITSTAKWNRPLDWKLKGDSKQSSQIGGKLHDIKTAANRNGCTSVASNCSGREGRMTYKERLSPWCIIRHLPQAQSRVVACSRRRNDAEEHLRVLRKMTPTADYSIIFDPMMESTDNMVNT